MSTEGGDNVWRRRALTAEDRLHKAEQVDSDDPLALKLRVEKAERERGAMRGRLLAKMVKVALKADPQTDGSLLEESVLLADIPEQGDAIEVKTPGGREWLDVDRRVFTPEGEIEVWVTMEGYDRQSLESAMTLAGEQFIGAD